MFKYCAIKILICVISLQDNRAVQCDISITHAMKQSVSAMSEFTLVATCDSLCVSDESVFFCSTMLLAAVVFPTVPHMRKVHTSDSKSHSS